MSQYQSRPGHLPMTRYFSFNTRLPHWPWKNTENPWHTESNAQTVHESRPGGRQLSPVSMDSASVHLSPVFRSWKTPYILKVFIFYFRALIGQTTKRQCAFLLSLPHAGFSERQHWTGRPRACILLAHIPNTRPGWEHPLLIHPV